MQTVRLRTIGCVPNLNSFDGVLKLQRYRLGENGGAVFYLWRIELDGLTVGPVEAGNELNFFLAFCNCATCEGQGRIPDRNRFQAFEVAKLLLQGIKRHVRTRQRQGFKADQGVKFGQGLPVMSVKFRSNFCRFSNSLICFKSASLTGILLRFR